MDRLSDDELYLWAQRFGKNGVHINSGVLRNITSELIEARAEIANLRTANQRLHRRAQKAEGANNAAYWWVSYAAERANNRLALGYLGVWFLVEIKKALERAFTPSRHSAGSPIPLDGATRTEPGFDGRPAPLAAPAPDTVAGAAQ